MKKSRKRFYWPEIVPAGLVFGCGSLWDVDRFFQRTFQVNSALLNHLTDVFYPVLLVFDAGGLGVCKRKRKRRRGIRQRQNI